MKLLIEVGSRAEFVDLLKEFEWQDRNGKLDDTLDGYQAAADNLRGVAARGRMEGQAIERERCAKICEDRAERLRATAEQYPAGTAACFAAEALECARRIRGEG